MLSWLLALAAGLALAALTYRARLTAGPSGSGARAATAIAGVAALRALAGTLVVALLLDAPVGPRRPVTPWLALDVSASWRATGDGDGWARARAGVDSLRGTSDSLLLFGDSVRGAAAVPAEPADAASRIGPLVESALALGRPVVVVTDGGIDDPEALARLPRGSRVVVVAPAARPDAAIAHLDAPRGALGGDTIGVRLVVKGGAAGSGATELRIALDDRALPAQAVPAQAVPALGPFEEREVRLRIAVPAQDARRVLRASLAAGDAVAANDTATAELVVSGAASAVFVSTAPDADARYALAVLRGTRRGPVQAYWRVAPGQWRLDGALRAVPEAEVRRGAAAAPLLVLHGDTAFLGAPRRLGPRGLVLIAPPTSVDDYYPSGAGDSPLSAALAGVPWDSLPPVDVGPMASGGFPAVLARRARRFDERVVVRLDDASPKVAVVPATGLFRWRLRGGRAADAFDAIWGTIFDWVGAEPGRPAAAATRGGPGPEWVPRRPAVAAGLVGAGAPLDTAPRALGAWWLALLAIAALCVEWILRRRIGLR